MYRCPSCKRQNRVTLREPLPAPGTALVVTCGGTRCWMRVRIVVPHPAEDRQAKPGERPPGTAPRRACERCGRADPPIRHGPHGGVCAACGGDVFPLDFGRNAGDMEGLAAIFSQIFDKERGR